MKSFNRSTQPAPQFQAPDPEHVRGGHAVTEWLRTHTPAEAVRRIRLRLTRPRRVELEHIAHDERMLRDIGLRREQVIKGIGGGIGFGAATGFAQGLVSPLDLL